MAAKRRAVPVPGSVWSALGPIPVVLVKELKDEKGEPLLGCWEVGSRVISVREGMDPTAMLATIAHEWVHAMLSDAGVKLPHDTEETIADALGTAIAGDVLSHL